ncbi:MAG: bifunctional (p)ppGpp synthetase/guanosine-3',5'-bis(diphosphate) 3'-pyrophosphohydrolase [Bryobacterales bacterium]|nr:bifunctional (p)ppGpp synthetase/guanosine-3',5'-bis(diphosphate) 3'-pyrophosphohydrolase [Bryobacterales bacterium]
MSSDPSAAFSPGDEAPLPRPDLEGAFRALADRVRLVRPKEDLAPLESAYRFAAERHTGQFRLSGEPYISHPLAVAGILAEMNMDVVSLQTALLHDLLEDTDTRLEEIEKRFGREVARCVDGVTKLRKLQFFTSEARQAESYRKMFLAMTDDVRVIIVKLTDRLHNMRTIGSLPREKQERIARETLEIYAPISHRLGMGKIRGELEDLAFTVLEPEASADLLQQIESRRHEIEAFLAGIRRSVEETLRQEGIPARVSGRVKRVYSIYQKMRRQKVPLDQVYDLLALRIVTDSVKNCYAALGVIHNEWHPIPGRIKDFIAIPRPNMYQALHTSVIGPGGHAFEVQIRTEEMHRVAEEGIAAHWKYKEGHTGPGQDDQRIAWLRQLVEWQGEMQDPGDFLSTLRVDLYPEEVCCFTPRGKVIVLPREATPIDFAYAIHSDVGHSCVGAKVNGRIVPLRYALRNGDVVEILTQAGHMPSKDWLALVKTSRARNKIKHIVNLNERAKAVEIGVKLLEKEARRLGLSLQKVGKTDLERAASDHGFGKVEDLQAALGYGRLSARQVLQKLAPQDDAAAPAGQIKGAAGLPTPAQIASPPAGDLVLKVKGADDLLVYRAKCCAPIPGDPIVGYVTRGKGVAVHSSYCSNVQNLLYEAERKIDVEWARSASEAFPVRMLVHTDDRPGILHLLTNVLAGEECNIRNLDARPDDARNGDGAVIEMTVDVKEKRQLDRIVSAMRRLSGVRDVERTL